MPYLNSNSLFQLLFFRPTPYGFRQVVQHVSKHVAYGINWLIKSRKGRCCSGRKSKLVEDRYIVLCTVTFIRKQETKHKETKTTTTPKTKTKKNTHKKQTPTQTTKQWRDSYQFMGEKDQLRQEVIAQYHLGACKWQLVCHVDAGP